MDCFSGEKKIKIETSGLLGVSFEPGEKRLWPLRFTANFNANVNEFG